MKTLSGTFDSIFTMDETRVKVRAYLEWHVAVYGEKADKQDAERYLSDCVEKKSDVDEIINEISADNLIA